MSDGVCPEAADGELLLPGQAAQHGLAAAQQTGFDAVDEVCIEDDGILSREGHEVGGTVVDVDVLVVGKEFDGDAESHAVTFETHIVYFTFEILEFTFTYRHLDSVGDVCILGADFKFLAILQAAIHETSHEIITDDNLLPFPITVMPDAGIRYFCGLYPPDA